MPHRDLQGLYLLRVACALSRLAFHLRYYHLDKNRGLARCPARHDSFIDVHCCRSPGEMNRYRWPSLNTAVTFPEYLRITVGLVPSLTSLMTLHFPFPFGLVL